MGHGNYSHAAHAALVSDRAELPVEEVFGQVACHVLMNPQGVHMREARDSVDHPESLAISFALDVTGSMGQIPRLLAQRDLPSFMKLLERCGIAHPQILFMAIGDATSDQAPVQLGQFESTAELMDQWLTWTWLEGGGGGTGEESYELAFYIAAQHTSLDCWTKRRKKGYLFLTGDELPYPMVSRIQVQTLFGDALDEDVPIEEVISAASETHHVFFLIPDKGRAKKCAGRWRELLGDHVITLDAADDTCAVAAGLVALTERSLADPDALAKVLREEGMGRGRVSSVVRALRPYAALIDPDSGGKVAPAGRTTRAPWWQRLFG